MALEVLYTQIEKEKILKLFDESDKFCPINKIGLLDELAFQIFGYAKIGSLIGKDQLRRDVYAFNCVKHGLQVTLLSGQLDKQLCNYCLLEEKTEFEETQRIKNDKEKLRDKPNKTKTDLSKFRTNRQNSM